MTNRRWSVNLANFRPVGRARERDSPRGASRQRARKAAPLHLEPPDTLTHLRYVDRLTQLVRSDEWLMEVLRAARACHPPEWVVGAGVLRNLVWDHLHGFAPHWGDEPQRGREPMGF